MTAMVAVFASYRTLNGIEAGTAFLVLMAGVKLLETRTSRDLTVLVFIAYFLLYAALLRNQQLQALPYLLLGVLLATGALMRVHAGAAGDSTREVLRRTGMLMLQAAPLALALFLLFPRLPGPFWGIQTSQSARTGLNDEMTPGDISDLSVSGDPAFRVRFFGPIPPPALRYWRGPVLHEFDGRSWRRARGQAFPQQEVVVSGEAVDYQITLEPHDRNWILALDLPSAVARARGLSLVRFPAARAATDIGRGDFPAAFAHQLSRRRCAAAVARGTRTCNCPSRATRARWRSDGSSRLATRRTRRRSCARC